MRNASQERLRDKRGLFPWQGYHLFDASVQEFAAHKAAAAAEAVAFTAADPSGPRCRTLEAPLCRTGFPGLQQI